MAAPNSITAEMDWVCDEGTAQCGESSFPLPLSEVRFASDPVAKLGAMTKARKSPCSMKLAPASRLVMSEVWFVKGAGRGLGINIAQNALEAGRFPALVDTRCTDIVCLE